MNQALQDFVISLFLFPILAVLFGYYAFICWFKVDQFHKKIEDNSKWYRPYLGRLSDGIISWAKSGPNLWLARIMLTFFFIVNFGMSIYVIATLFIIVFKLL
jgi:hypothetical protein